MVLLLEQSNWLEKIIINGSETWIYTWLILQWHFNSLGKQYLDHMVCVGNIQLYHYRAKHSTI